MRIGIDGGCMANRRGFGRFARQMVKALAEADSPHEFTVFIDRPSRDAVEIPARFRTIEVSVREAPSQAASSTGRRGLADLFAMGRAVARARVDLMYFPATYSFFPVWGCRRVVVTMHDTLALAHPEWVFPGGKGRLAWKLKEHAGPTGSSRSRRPPGVTSSPGSASTRIGSGSSRRGPTPHSDPRPRGRSPTPRCDVMGSGRAPGSSSMWAGSARTRTWPG